MANFYFKGFTVRQSGAAMKVNTDGVLLPAWVTLPASRECPKNNLEETMVLDAGSGTGVISLIMACRLARKGAAFKIHGIDIDQASYEESLFNFESSPWNNNIVASHISLQQYSKDTLNHGIFDMVLSNPPFFSNSLKTPSLRRSIARHNDLLPPGELLESSFNILKEDGILALVLPANEGNDLVALAASNGMFDLKRLCRLKTLENKEPKRYLIELQKKSLPMAGKDYGLPIVETLVMQHQGGSVYTREYVGLVGEYYLKELAWRDGSPV